ncbi:hypothetical protein [Novosphingobium sp. JCM 18896]|uniref:hypothetical protein n=1 Tax=Novosphingobium sp. JCM 18896 TaxID=2989731 RepID=UPI002222FB32|nr:hypothetical protein [Novosphingobium sp. JCM 18896]MCW1429799.1 hypothetical protein [Novosphingobium sp. JCM 18896]
MSGYVLRRLEPHFAEILSRYEAGEPFDTIAADHACAGSTVRRLLLGHGIELRPTKWQLRARA